MITNGLSRVGIFIYSPGIAVEPGDFLIYNNNIYIVKDPRYDGSVSPDHSIYCNLYPKEVLGDGIVTSEDLDKIVNTLVKGLGIDGSIKTIEVKSFTEFDNYLNTAVYNVYYNLTNYLFRCYKLDDGRIIQERINYSTPSFEYRTYSDGSWTNWIPVLTCTERDTLNTLQNRVNTVGDKINAIRHDLELVSTNNKYMYCKRLSADNNGIYWTTNEMDILLNVIVKYKINDQWYQTCTTIDPNAQNDDNKGILPSITKSGHRMVIQSHSHSSQNLKGYSFNSTEPVEVLAVLVLNKY